MFHLPKGYFGTVFFEPQPVLKEDRSQLSSERFNFRSVKTRNQCESVPAPSPPGSQRIKETQSLSSRSRPLNCKGKENPMLAWTKSSTLNPWESIVGISRPSRLCSAMRNGIRPSECQALLLRPAWKAIRLQFQAGVLHGGFTLPTRNSGGFPKRKVGQNPVSFHKRATHFPLKGEVNDMSRPDTFHGRGQDLAPEEPAARPMVASAERAWPKQTLFLPPTMLPSR